MKEGQLKHILDDLAEQAVPAEVDLWPTIQSHLEMSKTHPIPGESSMNPSFAPHRRLRFVGAALLAVILTIAVLLATASGRALAQNILLFFSRTKSNAYPIPTQDPASLVAATEPNLTATLWPTATPRPETLQPFHSICGSLPYPRCTMAQIGQMVTFPVKGLAAVPESLEFTGVSGGPDQITLMYQGSAGMLFLAQGPASQDDLQDWEIAAETLVEAVSIGNILGEYVQGSWAGAGISEAGTVPWETHSARQTLRWDQDGIRYTLWYYSSKTSDGRPAFDKASLVELAGQLTSKPTAPIQAPYLTLQQAAARAVFTAHEPAWLPAGYLLAGATYAPDRNAICLHYRYRLEAAAPTLTIFESLGWLPAVDEIKIKQTYNGQPIDIPTTIVSLAVGGSESGYATLASNGVNLGLACGGIEMTTNKALLWRANGMSFILSTTVDQFQGRGFLSNLEMRRVAEGLTGEATIPADTLDPERLTSIELLKTLTGLAVKAPTRMLADFHFDHAVYLESGSQDNPFWGISENEDALLIYLGHPIGDGSDGRFYSIFIAQTTGSETQTLEETALGGGFEPATVNHQPALYQQSCWVDTAPGGFTSCTQTLAWFENDVRYEIDAFLDNALPKELLIAIAESMR